MHLLFYPFSNTNKASFARGVIPAQDYQFLYDAGVVAIFGPGTSVAVAGKKILEVLSAAHEE